MKTAKNVARVSALMIRAAVKDLRIASRPAIPAVVMGDRRYDALGVLDGVAKELEQYAGAFEPEASHSPKNESPALSREGLSGAGSTVQRAGDANSEGSKSSAPSMPSEDDCTATTATQAERSISA